MSGNVKAKIRAATLAERTVPICLTGELVSEFEMAERALLEVSRQPKQDNMEGPDLLREAAERVEGLRQRMLDDQIVFRLRALPRLRYRDLVNAHPPRRTDDDKLDERDAEVGVNIEIFGEALIRACTVEPVLDDEDWRVLLGDSDATRERLQAAGEPVEDGKLSDGQIEALWKASWALNKRDTSVPFSRAASQVLSRNAGE